MTRKGDGIVTFYAKTYALLGIRGSQYPADARREEKVINVRRAECAYRYRKETAHHHAVWNGGGIVVNQARRYQPGQAKWYGELAWAPAASSSRPAWRWRRRSAVVRR